MRTGSLIREIVLKTLNTWRNYLSQNRADQYSEGLEKTLLFTAAFSNIYDESLQHKVHALYEQCLNKLWANQERKLLIYDFAPIIILEKTFSDFAQDEDEWFHKIIYLNSSRSASSRLYSSRLLLFYLNKKVDFKNEVMGVSLKDILIKNAYTCIESHYYENIHLFALITFLNIPGAEKKELFLDLLEYARKQEAEADILILEKLLYPEEALANPFFQYLVDCQQTLLKQIIDYEFNPQKLGTPVQLDLFSQPIEPKFNFYFEDPRFKSNLSIEFETS